MSYSQNERREAFQSTLLHEERHSVMLSVVWMLLFQSTLLHEERQLATEKGVGSFDISIHAPT